MFFFSQSCMMNRTKKTVSTRSKFVMNNGISLTVRSLEKLWNSFPFYPCITNCTIMQTVTLQIVCCLTIIVGSLEKHGSIIAHLLSQVRIGMDLTKVVLPTFILERRSLLEMYADFFAHPDLFVRYGLFMSNIII